MRSSSSPFIQLCNFHPIYKSSQKQQCIKQLIFMRVYKQFIIEKPNLNYNINDIDKQWTMMKKNKNIYQIFKENQNYLKQANNQNHQILREKKINDDDMILIGEKQINRFYTNNINQQYDGSINQQYDGSIKNIQQHPTTVQMKFKQFKTKIIKKVKSKTINKQKQLMIQKSYSKYLLNYLHKTNLLLIHRNIPPLLSVLQTIDDGDYLDETSQKKEYPHYSNVLQITQLPTPRYSQVKLLLSPKLVNFSLHIPQFNSLQQNTIFKLKQIFLFIEQLFLQSIYICSQIREMNNNNNYSLKLQNQNHQFQLIGQKINLNFKTTKLLYDILNDHYDLEKQLEIGKNDDYKLQIYKEITQLLKSEIYQYYSKFIQQQIQYNNINNIAYKNLFSEYIPFEENYLSLKQLRMIFLHVYNNQK